MRPKFLSVRGWALAVSLMASCKPSEHPLFKLLGPNETGISFQNTITTTDSLNELTDPYVYNGAGVAVGDIDNDGLPDIFFAGNMVSSKLYLNKGGMRFEDITKTAGVTTARWATGVTTIDINNDGYLDIYVAVSGPQWSKAADRANLLFINNRNRTFTEAAAQYGIADTGFTTHAVFLDYNKDGCPDLFLLNNSPSDFSRGVSAHPAGARGTPGTYNALYKNDCHGKFTDVSRQAGILRDPGYGLGVVVADLNGDGWPDIYVSNDVMPNDVVYANNHDGTFTNQAAKWLKHTSFAGMGVDVADFNNDGRPDIIQADMMPGDLARRKRTNSFLSEGNMLDSRSRGFRDDYSENSLQLNNGAASDGSPVFSEIARMAGVSQTDWSWSALFADFDNDGYKDIFIGNGYPKAVNDLDYMNALSASLGRGDKAGARRLLTSVPGYRFSSFIFRNNGDLTFTNKTKPWGIDQPSYSYGAAYADLNNDGKLDLVVNNIDGPAFIYENVAPKDDSHHYLEVRLVGEAPRQLSAALGAELIVSAGGIKQYLYYSPYRGFMSSMDDRAHFGLGAAARVDSLQVIWPDGRYQLLTNLSADRLVNVKQIDAAEHRDPSVSSLAASATSRAFRPVDLHGLQYKPEAATQMDSRVQPLLPYSLSSHGPAIAVADVNGDGLEDIFIGGGNGVPGKLLLQRKDGSFSESSKGEPWDVDQDYEDWGAAFFDCNGDGRPDLYVASGGYALPPGSPLLQDRLYVNQGNGKFARDNQALPQMLTSKSVVRVGDFNGDRKPDLFVGGRLTPRNYPYPTRSYVLRNDGGRFTDVTETVAADLVRPGGMVTDAAWVDFDGDGRLDLVTVGDWMPVQFFRNGGKQFANVTASTGLPSLRGWWYSLSVGDFDNDRRPDLIVGNLGLNYSYRISKDTTFGMYAGNFAGNQTSEVILTQGVKGKEYPVAGLAQLGREIYQLGISFPTAGSFSNVALDQAFSSAQLGRALHYEVDTFASMYLHNDGAGKFTSHPLPNAAQIAPIRGIVVTDVDGDGNLDLIVAGNLYEAEPNTARADAGNGLWLKGDGKGRFTPVSPAESGLLAPKNVSGLTLMNTAHGKALIVANTADSLQVFRVGRH
jgi:hypothetical protein